ncbi:hypothetical protein V7157_28635 [Neobacillus drentensis]|uniref:hypothetical protein n=1 Tax=Neobacillus drentensis TaxID=220684 RepID=UPI003001B4C5
MDRYELIYKILKSIEQGKEPHWNDFGIDKEEFGLVAEHIKDNNLATNVTVSRGGLGNKVQIVFLNHSKLTSGGYDFIRKYEDS